MSVSWLTYTPSSGTGDGTITITASTNSLLAKRAASVIVYNAENNISGTTQITQNEKES